VEERLRAIWIPGLFFLLGILGILALQGIVRQSENEQIDVETQITAEQIRLRLEAWIDARVAVVQHLGNKQFIDQNDIDALFAEQAQHLMAMYPGIQAINYVDDYWVIRIVVPEAANLPALNQDLHHHPNPGVREALQLAADSGGISSTGVIDLLQGGIGFVTYQALLVKSDLALGFINGVFHITTMLDDCLAEDNLRDRFQFEFCDESGAIVYLHSASSTDQDWEHGTIIPVRIVDRDWTLKLAPSASHLAEHKTLAATILAVTGLVLVTLLALLLRAFLLRQEALRDSQAKYRLLVENQNDLVVQIDDQGCFHYISPSYCEVFGKSEDELLGHNILPQVHPDDREALDRSLVALQGPPHHSFHEMRFMTKDGWRWLAWSSRAVLSDKGELEAITAVGRDVTARRKLEEKLIQSQKMQAIGLLAGGIAHDFNNLLHTMLNNLEFVFQETPPTGQARNDLEQVRQGVTKAMGLTRQLLAFGRQQMLQPTPLDLNSVLESMLQMMNRMIDASITIEFSPSSEPVRIHADRVQVEQIFMNLCVNAQDAIDGQGSIRIATYNRDIDADFCSGHTDATPGKYGVLTVQDTGQGMESEVLDRIFEPFFTTKEVGQGSGLGLSSIYGIVRQHDGFMLVESQPGSGTRFDVYLPMSEKVSPPPAPAPVKSVAGGSETILLAEDNADVRNLAVRVLQRGGYNVLVAEDGEEAVGTFQEHQGEVDLVMLDLVMPRLGGREAGQQIRGLAPEIKLLFASGYDPRSVNLETEGLDQADLLMKPFGIPELLGKVREILDR
jgi:PAS domain S-box-containing protein